MNHQTIDNGGTKPLATGHTKANSQNRLSNLNHPMFSISYVRLLCQKITRLHETKHSCKQKNKKLTQEKDKYLDFAKQIKKFYEHNLLNKILFPHADIFFLMFPIQYSRQPVTC